MHQLFPWFACSTWYKMVHCSCPIMHASYDAVHPCTAMVCPSSLPRMEGEPGCRWAHSHGGPAYPAITSPPLYKLQNKFKEITLYFFPQKFSFPIETLCVIFPAPCTIKTVLFWHFIVPDASKKVKFKTTKILWRNLQKMMLSLIIPQKLISLYSYLFIHTSVIFNNGNSGRHRLHLNTALFFCRVP